MQTHTWHTWHTWHTHLLVVFSTYCMCKINPTVFSFHQPSWLSNFSVFCLIHWEMLSMRIQFYILQPSLSVWVYCLCKNLERDRLQNWKSYQLKSTAMTRRIQGTMLLLLDTTFNIGLMKPLLLTYLTQTHCRHHGRGTLQVQRSEPYKFFYQKKWLFLSHL